MDTYPLRAPNLIVARNKRPEIYHQLQVGTIIAHADADNKAQIRYKKKPCYEENNPMTKKKAQNTSPTIDNRQARFKYSISETFEAGLELRGSEVKSIRAGQASLKEGYVAIKNGEMFLIGVHIAPFEQAGNHDQHESVRNIRLLMHKREILKLGMKIDQDRLVLVPLKMYFKQRHIKIQLGLGKGKKLHDKREDVKRKDIERSLRKQYKI